MQRICKQALRTTKTIVNQKYMLMHSMNYKTTKMVILRLAYSTTITSGKWYWLLKSDDSRRQVVAAKILTVVYSSRPDFCILQSADHYNRLRIWVKHTVEKVTEVHTVMDLLKHARFVMINTFYPALVCDSCRPPTDHQVTFHPQVPITIRQLGDLFLQYSEEESRPGVSFYLTCCAYNFYSRAYTVSRSPMIKPPLSDSIRASITEALGSAALKLAQRLAPIEGLSYIIK